jgi:chromosome partitioning protein
MAVISLLSRTAGVGKSTLTAALADFLSTLHGLRVLVVDLDPQATASRLLLGQEAWSAEEQAGRTLADMLHAATTRAVPTAGFTLRAAPARPLLSVVLGSPRLQGVEDAASETIPTWSPYAGSPYQLLAPALTSAATTWDAVLVDCGPALGLFTLNALASSTGYLVVTTPPLASLRGLQQMQERIARHAAGLGKSIAAHGTIVNRVRAQAGWHAAILSALRTTAEWRPTWQALIPEGVRLGDLDGADGGSIPRALAQGGAGPEYRALEALAVEFLQRIG